MKKLLLLILIALILSLTIFTIVNGIELGDFTILGIQGIKEKNTDLDAEIKEATTLVTVSYPKKADEMNASVKELEEAKKEYEDMVSVSTSDEISIASQILNYKIEVLWTKIGIHAKKEGVKINIAVVNGTGSEDNYNLNFTVAGSYINISEFIRDIEDDSTIGFKIEDFALKPGGSEENLQATFTCKNIIIKDLSQISTIDKETEEENTENNTNTTNKTNTTNSTNTTKSTNTTNSTKSNTTNTTKTNNTSSKNEDKE